jgi:hypothetical protein
MCVDEKEPGSLEKPEVQRFSGSEHEWAAEPPPEKTGKITISR